MITLGEAMAASVGRKEFLVKQTEETIVFDYVVTTPDSFLPSKAEMDSLGPDRAKRAAWVRRNFRGITFDKVTGDIISLPLHKFFNINQNEESRFELHRGKRAAIYEKLDGSMIHFYRLNGRLIASTCRSPESEQAQSAMLLAKEKSLLPRISESIDKRLTPIFEYCSPSNQIVVRYNEPRLVYLVSRSIDDGMYVFEEGYGDCAKRYEFEFADIASKIVESGYEGYVCHLEDGNIFKVKTSWYLERHRCVDIMMKPSYFIYEFALYGKIDDLMPYSPDNLKKSLESVWTEVNHDFLLLKESLEASHAAIRNSLAVSDNRKRFVEEVRKVDPDNFSEHMMMFSGKSVDDMLRRKLLDSYKAKHTGRFFGGQS